MTFTYEIVKKDLAVFKLVENERFLISYISNAMLLDYKELFDCCISLFQSPSIIYRKTDTIILIITPELIGSAEIILEHSDLTGGEKFASLVSLMNSNIDLNDKDLNELLNNIIKLDEFEDNSIPWDKTFDSWLLPFMSLLLNYRTRISTKIQFLFKDFNILKNTIHLIQFLETEDQSLSNFLVNKPKLTNRSNLPERYVYEACDLIVDLKNLNELADFESKDVWRLLKYFSQIENTSFLLYQINRISIGVKVIAEERFDYQTELRGSKNILTVIEYDALSLHVKEHEDCIIRNVPDVELELIYFVYSALGVEKAEELFDLFKLQNMSFETMCGICLELIKPEYYDVPIVWALNLAKADRPKLV